MQSQRDKVYSTRTSEGRETTMAGLAPRRRHKAELMSRNLAQSFRQEFGDLMERFFGDNRLLERYWKGGFEPSLDLWETEGEVIVTAEVPGMSPQDIDIKITGDLLTITGEKKEEKKEEGHNVRWAERSFGSFSRSVTLPYKIKTDMAEARYKEGILTLKLPKSEPGKANSVKIDVK
jgi:HSP20 family protein